MRSLAVGRGRTYGRTYTISIDINNVGVRSRSPQSLVECRALWGERERSRRQYRSQVAVFKSTLFSENGNADNIKKRRTVADSVTSVGESGDLDPCLCASVASLGVNTPP